MRPRARRVAIVLSLWVVIVARQGPAQTEQQLDDLLERAKAAMAATDIDQALALLQDLTARLTSTTRRDLFVDAHVHLATLHWATGSVDSAGAHFAAAIRRDAFLRLDTLRYNPDLTAHFRDVKRRTAAVGIRIPPDTLIDPETESWPIELAVGRPQMVDVRLRRVAPPGADTLAQTIMLDSVASFAIRFEPKDSVPLVSRDYVLVARTQGAVDSASFRVVRQPVDTLPHARPPDSASFRPEHRKGAPPASSVLKGLVFGAAAGAIPLLIPNQDIEPRKMDVRAAAVGASITVAGLVGLVAGRRDIVIQENVDYNERLRQDWRRRELDIVSENLRRRLWARIRITRVGEP